MCIPDVCNLALVWPYVSAHFITNNKYNDGVGNKAEIEKIIIDNAAPAKLNQLPNCLY